MVLSLRIFQDEGLYLFSPRVALTVGGVAGHVYVLQDRSEPYPIANPIIAIVAGGALLLTEADVSDWARTGNDDPIPADKLTLAPAGDGDGDGDGGGVEAGVDPVAREAAEQARALAVGAGAEAAAAEAAAAAAQSTADAATTVGEARALIAEWARTDNRDKIPIEKLPDGLVTPRVTISTAEPADADPLDIWIQDQAVPGAGHRITVYERSSTAWRQEFTWTTSPAGAAEILAAVVAVVEPWAQVGDATPIPAGKLVNAPGGGGAPTYTELSQTSLSGTGYTLSTAHANVVAQALIDGTGSYRALILELRDFNRHHNIERILLGTRNYTEGTAWQWYESYVNNSTGALFGIGLAIRRNAGSDATVTLHPLAGGTIDSGTVLLIHGEE